MIRKQFGKNIILRPITKEDTGLIVTWRNNEMVRTKFIFQECFTKEMHNNWFDTKVATGEVVQFIIERLDEKPIGSVYLRDINYEKGEAEYGIFIGEKDDRGKGYGTEAARMMLDYAYSEMKLKKVYLRVFQDNRNAIRSYEKAGFVFNSKEEDIDKNGKRRKIIFMEKSL